VTLGTNLLLALLWAALIGPFTPANLLVGFVVGYLILRLCSPRGDEAEYVRRAWAAFRLAGFTIVSLIQANLRVARHTVSRLGSLRPAVLAVPLEEGLSDAEVTLLATLITLTPGTLTLDVSGDRRLMFVHFMHIDDEESAIDSVKSGFEKRILEVTR
jgi:multicomponent Na+:H+ antiporter subunit E